MPSFSVGFAQVEARLRIVRRRLNLLTLQDALYLSGAVATLAGALLVVLALRGRASFFAAAAWAAIAAIVAATIAATLRIRRRWLSFEQVIRLADRQAALDDRLATLLLDPRRTDASRLKDILLEQILAATPRWDVDSLAPRRVPRSLFALAASLAALIVASFFVRPPALPSPVAAMRPHVGGADAEDGVLQPRSGAASADSASQTGGSAALQLAAVRTDGDRSAQLGSSKSGGQGTGAQAGTAPGVQSADDSSPAGHGSPDAGGTRSIEAAPQGMAGKLQDAIREALGAKDVDRDTRSKRRTGRPDQEHPDQDHKGSAGSTPGNRVEKDGMDSAGKEARTTTAQPPSPLNHMPGSGSGATAGAGAGQSPTELFGTQASNHLLGSGSQNLSIKLGAFSGMAPSQVEPQRQAPPVGDLTVSGAAHSVPPPLPDEQIPDAPLQKADVAPQHEALVRRIFTRDE
jgi:hypothetical protein